MSPPTILIVEDESDIQIVLTHMILRVRPSAKVGVASDGAEALRSIGQCVPDLLITDSRMPKVDGLTLIRTLRARQATFPILMMSAYPDHGLLAIAAGATGFLLKPFTPADVQQALNTLLPP